MEEQARRRGEEKTRRLRQQAEVARQEREASAKIAARAFSQTYLSGLVPSVFSALNDGGYFYDPQERGSMGACLCVCVCVWLASTVYVYTPAPLSLSHTHTLALVHPRPCAEVESQFMPWLMDGVEDKLRKHDRARRLLDSPYPPLYLLTVPCISAPLSVPCLGAAPLVSQANSQSKTPYARSLP